jgi:hypothetical protein
MVRIPQMQEFTTRERYIFWSTFWQRYDAQEISISRSDKDLTNLLSQSNHQPFKP